MSEPEVELLQETHGRRLDGWYGLVRYGNVLGSASNRGPSLGQVPPVQRVMQSAHRLTELGLLQGMWGVLEGAIGGCGINAKPKSSVVVHWFCVSLRRTFCFFQGPFHHRGGVAATSGPVHVAKQGENPGSGQVFKSADECDDKFDISTHLEVGVRGDWRGIPPS